MSYRDDPAGFEQRLNAKLQPESIRATLAFAGLYQMTYEMLRCAVLDKVREFYSFSLTADGSMSDKEQERYRLGVLSLAPKNKFRASLVWLVNRTAIRQSQADRLDAVYAHRHSLAHELVKYIVDPVANPDIELLSDAISTLRDLHRFWVDVELSNGGFLLPDGSEVGEFDADEVVPLSLIVLQQCLDAYLDGLAATES
jgi:hypothetical protein